METINYLLTSNGNANRLSLLLKLLIAGELPITIDDIVIDFGSGKHYQKKKAILEKVGYKNVIFYDKYVEDINNLENVENEISKYILTGKKVYILSSNVLNVIPSERHKVDSTNTLEAAVEELENLSNKYNISLYFSIYKGESKNAYKSGLTSINTWQNNMPLSYYHRFFKMQENLKRMGEYTLYNPSLKELKKEA